MQTHATNRAGATLAIFAATAVWMSFGGSTSEQAPAAAAPHEATAAIWTRAEQAPLVRTVLEHASRLRSIPDNAARASALRELAADPSNTPLTFVLCRLLFEARPGGEFRRPLIGDMHFVAGTSYGDWPLAPIAIIDGVPITVMTGVMLAGLPEEPIAYVDYCLANCVWAKPAPTPATRASSVAPGCLTHRSCRHPRAELRLPRGLRPRPHVCAA